MNEATQQAPQPIGSSTGNLAAEKMPSPSREKYWEECTPEQKADRLREAVARICRDMNVVTACIQRLSAHSHGENGLLVPIHYADPSTNQSGGGLVGGLYAHDHGIPHNLRTERERR